MKKKIIGLMAFALLLTGCGKVPKLENGKDAVVSFNNGEKISVDDLYNKIKDLAFNIMKRQKGGIYMNHCCSGNLGAAIILVLFILLIIIVGAYI